MQDEPPSPEDEAVFIESTAAFTAYVVSYSGWQSEDKFTKHAGELFEQLHQNGISVREDMYYAAGYDSPFRLTDRHNEVGSCGTCSFRSLASPPCPPVFAGCCLWLASSGSA